MATGTGNLPNPSMSFSPFAILTAEQMNNLVSNINSLATGTGIGDASVNTAAIADGAVTNAKISTTAITLGYAEKTSSFTTTSSTSVIVTGLSTSVVIPSGGRKIEITTWASFLDSGTESFISLQIWDGVVGSGTMLAQITPRLSSNNRQVSAFVMAIQAPSAGSKTYNIGVKTTAGIAEVKGESNSPSFILVKAI